MRDVAAEGIAHQIEFLLVGQPGKGIADQLRRAQAGAVEQRGGVLQSGAEELLRRSVDQAALGVLQISGLLNERAPGFANRELLKSIRVDVGSRERVVLILEQAFFSASTTCCSSALLLVALAAESFGGANPGTPRMTANAVSAIACFTSARASASVGQTKREFSKRCWAETCIKALKKSAWCDGWAALGLYAASGSETRRD